MTAAGAPSPLRNLFNPHPREGVENGAPLKKSGSIVVKTHIGVDIRHSSR
jgi:hypothetical protein